MKNQNKSKSLYLYPKLKVCSNEGEVRTVYEQGLTFYFSDDVLIKNHYGCDNYIDTYITDKKHLRLLVEYKGQRDLESNREIAKIIIQIIFYLKKFENAGKRLPNVIMVGVKEYCFVIHSNNLLSYLDKDVNWSIAPSSAYVKYPEVTAEIANDSTIISAVKSEFWIIDSSFDFKQVIDVVCDLCENVKKHVRITEQNISEVFNYFRSRVLLKKDLSANDQVSCFVGILTNDNSYYAHPKKKNLLVTPFAEIPINSENYKSFFMQYDSTYTPDEKRKLTSIMDRLIEDTIRRKQGAFFTPCEFVSFAHSMIEKELGENWRDDYVVFDPCCYDSETEFCSDKGWKRFSDYTEGDKVLQFNNDMTASFVDPLEYIKYENEKGWCSFSNSQINFRVTPDHDLVVFNDTNKDKQGNIILKKEKALSVMERACRVKNSHTNTFKSFFYNGDIHVDEWILRIAIAINADGCLNKYRTLGNNKNRTKRNTRFTENDSEKRDVFVITVKKERKKERCRFLLEKAGISYVSRDDKDGYTEFAFHFPFNPKEFPVEWYHLDKESKQIFLDEIFLWDGSIQKNTFRKDLECLRKTYFTTKKKDADLVSFLMSSSGHGVNYRVDYRTGLKPCYYVAMTKYTTAKLSNRSDKESFWKKETSNKEMCYCFRVPSGMLVVRRNNKIMICGNCGSLNLTRDFHFNELYCSTLDKGELDLGSRYNQNAKKWVMDFLNDSDDKFDDGLIKAFEQNKPIVFFINPPYGTAGNWLKENKTCTNNTVIRELMLKEKFGGSENLQHQFMYRITKLVEKYNLTNAYFALFSNPIWLSGAKQGIFLKNFTSRWECKDAYLFQASHFADVSDAWGISLTLWEANSNATPITKYNMKLIDMLDDGSIDVIGHHTIYNSYFYNKASDWVREPIKTRKDKVELPNMTSGLLLDTKGRSQKGLSNQLGCIFSKSNSISLNQTCVALFSIPYADGHSIPICSENFTRCTMLFTARKLIENTWINHADEYLAPNENHPDYKRFEVDSVVYSLFENKSNQTSMRQITYKGKLYDIPNEFFWVSKEEMKNLANTHHDDFMYDDASISKERYVFTLLQKPEIKKYLSKTAKQLLQIATELVIESMQYRTEFEADHPDHHIHCWDCGYYQLKNLWKQYLPDKFKKFRELYKQFGNELRPLVYELGFLRQ